MSETSRRHMHTDRQADTALYTSVPRAPKSELIFGLLVKW